MAMPAFTWRALSVFLLLVILLQFYLILSHEGLSSYRPSAQPVKTIPALQRPKANEWRFEEEKDGNNPGLTSEQCDAAFPDLYYEIDRSVKLWKDRGHEITPEDIDLGWRRDAAMRILIYNNQLRVLQAKNTWQPKGYGKRALPMLSQLHRALLGASAAGETLPTIEFSVVVDDMSLIPGGKDDNTTTWAFTRNLHDRGHDREWIIPDFNYWANPPTTTSFHDMQLRAHAHDMHIHDKIPQAVWRGVRWTNEAVRGNLLTKSAGKDWADIREMEWKNKTDFMRMEDFCRYAYIVHTEGRSWSGRLKYILNCDSVPVVHALDWTAHLYHLLVPDGPEQNYVAVRRDFGDLEKEITYLIDHPDVAQRIADNAVATFRARYTTMAAESCYWRALVRGWSEVAFQPETHERVRAVVNGEEVSERRVRGKPFEELVVASEEDVLEWARSQEGEV